MPINAHPDYFAAEKAYLIAETKEQKIRALKKMISHAPKHKGAENLRAQLKKRLAKLKYTKEKEIKQKKGGKTGIRKEDMQAIIIGKTGAGKSRLLAELTNAKPKIGSEFEEYTTKELVVGMINYLGTQIQLIENPAIGSGYYDKGLTNTADTLLILVTELPQIEKIEKELINISGKKIIIFNNKINADERKISATLQSKKYDYVIVNLNTKKGIEELKEKLFQSFGKIRIYTKEPSEKQKSDKPIILNPDSTVKDVAEKILKGFSNKVKETKIWGPSSKYPGQIVGLAHAMKDLDIVEFKTR